MANKLLWLFFKCSMIIYNKADRVNDTEQLFSELLTNYNSIVRPVTDHTKALNVSIALFVKSFKEFNEVEETLSYTGALLMTRKDFRLKWSLTVPVSNVWLPEIFLASPATTKIYFVESWNKARIWDDGTIELLQEAMIETTCSLNVKYYPFDVQACDTLLMSLVYKNNEVNLLKIGQTGIDFTLYQNNSLWEITPTSVYAETLTTGTELQMHFIFYLKRKSAIWFAVCTVPESGERIGYCITTLLAIAVYMAIIMDTVPQSSDPVPLISYKLMIDLISSSLIIVVVIFNLRLHNKDGDQKVSCWLMSLYRVLTFYHCKKKKVNPELIHVKDAT
ncbi:ACHA6-like protein [Mya arenaria]|uniref:ACHA6-like protein n=1 Tax=Mya arenaria TaxID=6604 RepID=A0ABY7EH95_MYAAR|nr:ACHA6-like protein [Mya arenaria]